MKTIRMTIEVDCDDAYSEFSADEVEWFIRDVLMNEAEDGRLILHSNELGCEVGMVRVLSVDLHTSANEYSES